MRNQSSKIKWYPAGHYPLHIGVAFNTKELVEEFQRLKAPEGTVGDLTNTNGRVYTLTNTATGGMILVVLIDLEFFKYTLHLGELHGLCTHEAVHVWQFVKDYIGEDKPGAEQEAYFIQSVSQDIFQDALRRLKVKDKVWSKKNTKKMKGTLKGKKGYSEAKEEADKKFGEKTSAVKNIYISKKMKGK